MHGKCSFSRTTLWLILALTIVLGYTCAGQDIARRDAIDFPHKKLAWFEEVSPDSRVYKNALALALEVTGVSPNQLGAYPRVVKGSSFLVDPSYLGRTSYFQGSIFVWEGTEVPVEDVLFHEMIHWVLFFAAGEPQLAMDEAYVTRLTETHLASAGRETSILDDPERARWYDVEVQNRNYEKHRRGVFNRDEPDSWGLEHERARVYVPRHP